jgi:predicted PurR-regulated permease PerM
MSSGTRSVLLTFAIGLALLLAYHLRSALMLIYVSLVFAVVLKPAVDWVQTLRLGRWSPGRGSAILLIIIAVLLALGLFFSLALPPIISDFQELTQQLPELVRKANSSVQKLPFAPSLNLQMIERHLGSLVGGITGLLSNAVNLVVGLVTAMVLTAYFILDSDRVFAWAIALFPLSQRPHLEYALRRAGDRMRRWIVGQAILMVIIGTSSLIVFGLLGVRYFFVLAVLAGVSNIIPMLGPVVSAIIAGLIAAIDSLGKVIGVLIFFLAYQQVENAYLTPRIMESQVKISSTAVLVALIVGGQLAGILGALVAVPTAVLVSVLISEYVIKRHEAKEELKLRPTGS